ncbi:LIC_12616 family protein [Rufibacter sediminis]|uniref:Phage neck terminator protein gp12-like domain-containing protein n=1 Tax=Rufibacter sediminis TaxID=2762756 RepID=A0ABR6VTX4_9BACT|nr:hypothetical protein [Rufibacter sediminis]MBC3540657.1 hypothetical protein [Rufibacter sediminis]
MRDAQIKPILQKWIIAATGLPDNKVVYANQNGPRPAFPYVTVHVTAKSDMGWADISVPDTDGVAEINNDRMVSISLQALGSGAMSLMETLRDDLERPTSLQQFRGAGLPFIRVLNDVNDLTTVVGTKYEERAGMDLEFRTAVQLTDEVGLIEAVTGESQINSEIKEVILTYETGV